MFFDEIYESVLSYNFDGKLAGLYAKFGYGDVIRAVLEIMERAAGENSLNFESFMAAATFVRDTATLSATSSDLPESGKQAFAGELARLGFFETIEKYLYSDYYTIKHITAYTIGKMSVKENAKYLEKAFETHCGKNPLVCAQLLFEMCWLESEKYASSLSAVEKDTGLIGAMTHLMHSAAIAGGDALEKAFEKFKLEHGEMFAGKTIAADEYVASYEILIAELHNKIKRKDFTAGEYERSIIFYTENYDSLFRGENTDWQEIYDRITGRPREL
ncbi:MAG: hypothetical protein FWG66_10780 [Spirochaetes bacterium]|nr:hypothetical protein [Spirochaetota bacterium]